MSQSAGFFSLFLPPIQGLTNAEQLLKEAFSFPLTDYPQMTNVVATLWGSEYTKNILCLQKGGRHKE